MSKSPFIRAGEVAKDLEVSTRQAYRLIRELNQELSYLGYMTVQGRVSRKYYEERFYRVTNEEQGDVRNVSI